MARFTGQALRVVADNRTVKAQVVKVMRPVHSLEEVSVRFRRVLAFCFLDLFRGYLQMPLAEESQGLVSVRLSSGQYTPTGATRDVECLQVLVVDNG